MMMNPKAQRAVVIGLVVVIGLAMVVTMMVAPA
jgi:hypothetical protein